MITEAVAQAVRRARTAQARIAGLPQSALDDMVAAVGWAGYREDEAQRIARSSHAETGLGDPDALFGLQRHRVLGMLRDLHGVRTVGVIGEDPARGLVTLAKPLGVIAVATPATAPGPGILCNALPMLKTGNAMVFTPHPRARRTTEETVRLIRSALAAVGAPEDLVQCLEVSGKEATSALMSAADHVVAIGGSGTVRRAYQSGTPAIGAGVGNPTVIVDETADLADAAEKIMTGAGFNNGTSCSSESNVLVHASVAERFRALCAEYGAHLCDADETAWVRKALWPDGTTLDRALVGRTAQEIARAAGIDTDPCAPPAVLVLDCPDLHASDPLLTEKLSPVVTLGVYEDFAEAVETQAALLDRCGRGHSCGIHSSRPERVMAVAARVDTCRVVVNQSTMTNTGSFTSGVPFTTVLSCGSWGGTSVSGNLTWSHLLNCTTVSRPLPERRPDPRALFGRHWDPAHGGDAAA
ncbi:aldehyde dehydrogenase family protein [Streptomyces sp. WAC06614]|uniref:aldehyde dehydrogenase family protein n=1 Tax=Streptomyces sp. WAC06614 TaxID=2487416 RepID=UPI000F7880B8|nr:aldehyde dehydrogenase family protein [Streptomyces sp. WAC06614]RSS80795.1 aldehyde dehydrogenase family protein [Streptomyces sp. WAC06614]